MTGRLNLGSFAPRAAAVLGGLLAVAALVQVASGLPAEPVVTGDSPEYLGLAAHRPPLYGVLLQGWQLLHGGLDHLPLAQFTLLAAGLLGCAVELARLLRVAVIGFAVVPLVLLHPVAHDIARWMMSESLFLSLVLGGIGLQLRFARTGQRGSLVGAAVVFALAAITRSTGMALLPLPLLTALLDRRSGPRAAGLLGAGCGLAMLLVLLAGMAVNNRVNHRFEIGSFAGIALLGKALLLVKPADLAMMPPGSVQTLLDAEQARRVMARQPDLAARLRAQLQATQDIRYASFFPAMQAAWPAWATATWRERSGLGQALAVRLVAAHPVGYARLWLDDWLSLVLYPTYWPGWASTEEPDRSLFPACRIQQNCWALERYDVALLAWLPPILISVGALVAGTMFLLVQGWSVLRRRGNPEVVLCCSLMLVIHATLLVSAATEAGFARYATPVHAMAVVVVLFLVDRLCAGMRTRLPGLHADRQTAGSGPHDHASLPGAVVGGAVGRGGQ